MKAKPHTGGRDGRWQVKRERDDVTDMLCFTQNRSKFLQPAVNFDF